MLTPGLKHKLSQGSLQNAGSLRSLNRDQSQSPSKFGGTQVNNINFGYMDMGTSDNM